MKTDTHLNAEDRHALERQVEWRMGGKGPALKHSEGGRWGGGCLCQPRVLSAPGPRARVADQPPPQSRGVLKDSTAKLQVPSGASDRGLAWLCWPAFSGQLGAAALALGRWSVCLQEERKGVPPPGPSPPLGLCTCLHTELLLIRGFLGFEHEEVRKILAEGAISIKGGWGSVH